MPKVNEEYLKERREHILKSAKSCFARGGFHKTTMRDIQKKASLSAGAVYRYFKSKEEIIEAIAQQDLEERVDLIGKTTQGSDPASRFEKLAEGFFSLLERKDKPFVGVELELWAEAQRNPKIMEIQRKSLETIKQRFAALIQAGQKNGELFADFNPEAAAHFLISIRRGLVAQLAVNKKIDIGEYTATITRILLRGLLVRKAGKE